MTGILQALLASRAAGGGFISATGGTVTDYNGFRIHKFTSSADFVISSAPAGATFELFIIAGGGGGGAGSSCGPGGGAGGAYWRTDYPCPAPGTYPMVIGAGGAGVNNSTTVNGTVGNPSTGFGLELVGGGTQNSQSGWNNIGGGGLPIDNGVWGSGRTSADGGCGGAVANGFSLANHPKWNDTTNQGRTVFDSTGGFAGSNQTYYYGYASGTGSTNTGNGGGGIGAVGGSSTSGGAGGNGGAGMSFNWTGSTESFGGGGGGGAGQVSGGTGGSGGGGNGGLGAVNGGNGTANTGGGAGGSASALGGTGGSGVIFIKYPIA